MAAKLEKRNLDYFIHNAGAYRDGKFRMLRKRFGWEGDGKFWALNGMIAESNGCFIDLVKKYDKVNLMEELEMNETEFDDYLDFLINDVDLVILEDEEKMRITTVFVQEIYERVKSKREINKRYYQKKKKENEKQEEESKEEDQEIHGETNSKTHDEIEKLTREVMSFFGLNEMHHFRQMADINKALRRVMKAGQIEHFKYQFTWYSKLKTNGMKHSLKNFLGTTEEGNLDGAWNAENWKDRYIEKVKERENIPTETKKAKAGKPLTFDY